jgi:hypothetical protein
VIAPARSFGQDARLVGTVSLAHFASHLFQLALPSLFPLLREALDVSYVALAFVMTVFYITSGVAQAAAGFAVDGQQGHVRRRETSQGEADGEQPGLATASSTRPTTR